MIRRLLAVLRKRPPEDAERIARQLALGYGRPESEWPLFIERALEHLKTD